MYQSPHLTMFSSYFSNPSCNHEFYDSVRHIFAVLKGNHQISFVCLPRQSVLFLLFEADRRNSPLIFRFLLAKISAHRIKDSRQTSWIVPLRHANCRVRHRINLTATLHEKSQSWQKWI